MTKLSPPPLPQKIFVLIISALLIVALSAIFLTLDILLTNPVEVAREYSQEQHLEEQERDFADKQQARAQHIEEVVKDKQYAQQLAHITKAATREDLYLAARQSYVVKVALPLIIIAIIAIALYKRKKSPQPGLTRKTPPPYTRKSAEQK